jgi:hypothetical protein
MFDASVTGPGTEGAAFMDPAETSQAESANQS